MRIKIRQALQDTEVRREMEKESLTEMIRSYCHGNHHTKGKELCEKCQEFHDYAMMRTDKCPFMATKTFCSACKVHCYSKEWRPYVKEVMRYAGPRLLFRHPVLTILHGWVTLRQKRLQKKQEKHDK